MLLESGGAFWRRRATTSGLAVNVIMEGTEEGTYIAVKIALERSSQQQLSTTVQQHSFKQTLSLTTTSTPIFQSTNHSLPHNPANHHHTFKMQFTTIFAATLFAATTVLGHPIPDSNPIHLRSLHARSGHTADIYAPFAGHAIVMARSYISRRGY
jgi:hypothetical protein